MALPGHRRTSSHKRRRASHFALKKTNTLVCPKCKAAIVPHRACAQCGTYRGRVVVDMSRRVARVLKRKKKPTHDHSHVQTSEEKPKKE